MTAAPNWYPDPAGGPRQRYWDGATWTSHLWPPINVDELATTARRAKTAILIAVPVQVAAIELNGVQIRSTIKTTRESIDQMNEQFSPVTGPQQAPNPVLPPMTPIQPTGVSALGSLTSLPILVIGIVFVMWFSKAATIAKQLGRPAKWSPGWAIGGWFIPIGSFFIPYGVGRDLLRAGDPRRSSVKSWWALYMGSAVLSAGLTGLAAWRGTAAVVLGVLALGTVIWLAAALAAMRFIEDATDSLSVEAAGVTGRTYPEGG